MQTDAQGKNTDSICNVQCTYKLNTLALGKDFSVTADVYPLPAVKTCCSVAALLLCSGSAWG